MKAFKPESDPRSLYGPGQSALRKPRLAILRLPKTAKVPAPPGINPAPLLKLKGLIGK